MVEKLSINVRRSRPKNKRSNRRDCRRSRSHSRSRGKSNAKDNNNNNNYNDNYCYYHNKFGARAIKCIKLCAWKPASAVAGNA